MRILLGLTAGISLVPGAALAQQGTPERRLDFNVAMVLEYDSNVIGVSDALLQPGDSEDDIRATPTASIDLLLPVGRQSVFLNGSVGYDFYAENKRLEAERVGLTGGVVISAGNSCSVTLTGDYGSSQSDPGDLLERDDLRNTQETIGYGGNVDCGSAIGLQGSAGYRRIEVDNSSAIRQFSNFSSDTFDASIGYARPALGEISIFGTWSEGVYPNRVTLPGLPQEEIESYTAGLRYSRNIGSRLRGEVSVGFTDVSSNQPGVPDFSGASYSASLSFTPNDQASATLLVARAVDQSNLLNVSFSITDTYSADAQYALSQRIRLRTGISYRTRELRENPLLDVVTLGRDDRVLRSYGGISYIVERGPGLSLDIGTERRRADNRLFNFSSFFAALTTRYSF